MKLENTPTGCVSFCDDVRRLGKAVSGPGLPLGKYVSLTKNEPDDYGQREDSCVRARPREFGVSREAFVLSRREARETSHGELGRNGNRHHTLATLGRFVPDGSSVASTSVETRPLAELRAAADEGAEA